jgi:L-iditol 2-dehydrogenase
LLAVQKSEPGPGHMELVDKAVPVPGPMQVRLEVMGAGVCGTDLHIVEAGYASHPPVTLGHEVSAMVREVGPGVDPSWIGARVSCETFYSTCGVCPWCRDGRPNLCPDRRSIGSGVDGGFAQFLVVFARQLHRIPTNVADHAAALCEPLACVCQSLCDPSIVGPGDDVLVIGPGTMGLLAAQVSRACGGRVLVIGTDRDRIRLDKALELGFEVGPAGDQAPTSGRADGYGPHVVIECSGSGAAMSAGLNAVRRGGHYVQIGQTADPVTVPLALVSFKEISITGGFASTPRSWRRAMNLLERDLVALEPLVSNISSLNDWERVFKNTGDARGIKYVFDPRHETA